MNPHYGVVAARAGHRCEYCHAPEAVFNFPFEVEHIVPVVRGGPDTADNQALACRSCNLFKSDVLAAVDEDTRETYRLFHPRLDRWQDHFVVGPEQCEVRGLTPVGRATVTQLRMNTPPQLFARQQWLRLGLFP